MEPKQMMALGAYTLAGLAVLIALFGHWVLPVLMLGTAAILWFESGEPKARLDERSLQEIEDYANRREGREEK
jgi:ABC-type branched-subunit amino acid transport system permease subunit